MMILIDPWKRAVTRFPSPGAAYAPLRRVEELVHDILQQ